MESEGSTKVKEGYLINEAENGEAFLKRVR